MGSHWRFKAQDSIQVIPQSDPSKAIVRALDVKDAEGNQILGSDRAGITATYEKETTIVVDTNVLILYAFSFKRLIRGSRMIEFNLPLWIPIGFAPVGEIKLDLPSSSLGVPLDFQRWKVENIRKSGLTTHPNLTFEGLFPYGQQPGNLFSIVTEDKIEVSSPKEQIFAIDMLFSTLGIGESEIKVTTENFYTIKVGVTSLPIKTTFTHT